MQSETSIRWIRYNMQQPHVTAQTDEGWHWADMTTCQNDAGFMAEQVKMAYVVSPLVRYNAHVLITTTDLMIYLMHDDIVKSLAHYKAFYKDVSEKNRKNICSYTKLLKKSLQLWKKAVVCMDNNYIFCSFSCSVRGP